MKNILKTLCILSSVLLSAAVTSCVDERLYIDPEIGEGEATLTASVVFSPVRDVLRGTRASGNALKHVNTLCVLFYNSEGNLAMKVPQEKLLGLQIENNNNAMAPDTPGDGGHQAESDTPKATFSIAGIPFGRYRIYAVANMGDLEGYDVSTEELLKNTPLIWNEDDISANDQMFGYFTAADNQSSQGFDAPLLAINRSMYPLHAWLKRAASKVTVNVDGSGLYDNVQVWIHSVQVRDIPRYCYLGADHSVSAHLISEGEYITYSTVGGQTGKTVTKADPIMLENAHAENAEALYFYENMQGEGQNKHQSWDGGESIKFPNGNTPGDQGFKDGKEAGTYVQVSGYYKNSEGEGPIIYRFMLGKDTETNYDAQRNYHYKLTLKLKNNANDNDWHIVYDPEPAIIAPNPYFISYTYDQSMNIPLKIVGRRLISLRADIPEDEINKNSWHAINPDGSKPVPTPYWDKATDNPGPWNGFLSLRKTRAAIVGSEYGGTNPTAYTYNKTYWEHNNRGWREYDTSLGKHIDATDGDYTITTNGGGEWEARIPLFTRSKQLVPTTGYTGNNPYVAYRRQASIVFTAEIEDAQGAVRTVKTPVTIQQMRRIVNPTGIWRSKDCADPFHVVMMVQEGEQATEFKPLESAGPWVAVIKNGDWFDLEPTEGKSQKNPDGTISGKSGSTVDFTFRPKGTTSTPRSGIIKIYYNNYTCIHLIFVRQGYAPVSFPGSTTKWHSFNLVTPTEEAADPVIEGSYFKQFNTDFPIAASNNTAEWFDKNGAERYFAIAGSSDSKKWADIRTSKTAWDTFTIDGKTCRLPKKADFDAITGNSNTIYGYGVLYTDQSSTVAESVKDAYEARDAGNLNGKGMRGVFVCDTITGTNLFFPIGASGYGRFKQLSPTERYNRQRAGWAGVVQYANRYKYFPETDTDGAAGYPVRYKPLFWDLWERPGALYWLAPDESEKYGLDINYYTYDFNVGTHDNLGIGKWEGWAGGPDPSGTDAILLRLVED